MERDEEGQYIYDPDEQYVGQDVEGSEDQGFGSPWLESGEEEEEHRAKPRKRLVKRSAAEDAEDEDAYGSQRKRKSKDRSDVDQRKRMRNVKEGKDGRQRRSGQGVGDRLPKLGKGGSGEREMKEMWDSLAGQDSEDDQEGHRTRDDDNFIDDTGLDVERYISDGDEPAGSAGDAPQAEEAEEDELKKYFQSGSKKKKKNEKLPEEIGMLVEEFMARLELAAEEDANCNRNSQPATNKLRMLSELVTMLEKRHMQNEFLSRGVLNVLKNWLEPLPDGSLPNLTIRSTLLKLLTDLPIEVADSEKKGQLKRSGLGKVVMFLSRLPAETPQNKKLARDLVDKWSRPLFHKSTNYEDLRQMDSERTPVQRRPISRPAPKRSSKPGDELEMDEDSREPRPGDSGFRFHASRPEALALDFVVRPGSKVDAEDVRARAKMQGMDEKRQKMNKRLQNLKTPKKKNLQAEKISVEGRGLAKFF